MKISELKKELQKVIDCQKYYADNIDSTNPSSVRCHNCAEDMAEITQAILKYINGDNVSIKMYQDREIK